MVKENERNPKGNVKKTNENQKKVEEAAEYYARSTEEKIK